MKKKVREFLNTLLGKSHRCCLVKEETQKMLKSINQGTYFSNST